MDLKFEAKNGKEFSIKVTPATYVDSENENSSISENTKEVLQNLADRVLDTDYVESDNSMHVLGRVAKVLSFKVQADKSAEGYPETFAVIRVEPIRDSTIPKSNEVHVAIRESEYDFYTEAMNANKLLLLRGSLKAKPLGVQKGVANVLYKVAELGVIDAETVTLGTVEDYISFKTASNRVVLKGVIAKCTTSASINGNLFKRMRLAYVTKGGAINYVNCYINNPTEEQLQLITEGNHVRIVARMLAYLDRSSGRQGDYYIYQLQICKILGC